MVRHRRRLPERLGLVALADRLQQPAMRGIRRMKARYRAVDVFQLLPPNVGHRRDDLSRNPDALDGTVHCLLAFRNGKVRDIRVAPPAGHAARVLRKCMGDAAPVPVVFGPARPQATGRHRRSR